jgi:hypothetical protein
VSGSSVKSTRMINVCLTPVLRAGGLTEIKSPAQMRHIETNEDRSEETENSLPDDHIKAWGETTSGIILVR